MSSARIGSGFGWCACLFAGAITCTAAEFTIGEHTFTLPDGFEIEQIAGPPLVDRPICADFDEQGRLYVADSSGSNDKVTQQLEERPHRILRLEDTDGDGTFDSRVIFADRMMFPEGTLWFDGSLYVAAPPQIWKLTDTDDDGEADRREVWFDGQTLTGCANDLHGPYLGPDGWIYWCKGAFAEQTYERPGRDPLVTKAAHIFRRRPEGGFVEPVMTGGMDNPVEVAFTPGGERIFSTTFLQRPGNGLRDGLIHAIYGGVYGKVNGVLEGHPRTGELMPPLSHLGPAAPCGLLHLESDQLGAEYQGNLLTCLFNMHRLTRHVLTPQGATFTSRDEDFLVSDNIDFHPTDVLEDADGSLVVIDTGGWYKLCCPTSNLWKPDILGGIYRVSRTGSHQVDDPRGKQIRWSTLSNEQLCQLLADSRLAVRSRSRQELRRRGTGAIGALAAVLAQGDTADQRLQAVWTLTSIDSGAARQAVQAALEDDDETVRQAALHSVSVWRDNAALPRVVRLLQDGQPHNQRVAAEALGRFGSPDAIEPLLRAAADLPEVQQDRAREHSLTYALIEIGDPDRTRAAVATQSPAAQRVAFVALDQMSLGELQPTEVMSLFNSDDERERETAWWIVGNHPEWAPHLVETFRSAFSRSDADMSELQTLARRIPGFAADADVQQMLSELVSDQSASVEVRKALLNAMASSGLSELPEPWSQTLTVLLGTAEEDLRNAAVKAVSQLAGESPSPEIVSALRQIAGDSRLAPESRLHAMTALPVGERGVEDAETLEFLCRSIAVDQPVAVRGMAVDVLTSAILRDDQMIELADALPDTGPMELGRLLEVFSKSADQQVGRRLVNNLSQSAAVTSLSVDQLKQVLASYGDVALEEAAPLFERILQDNRDKYQQLESVLALLDGGDIRRGQRVFHNTKVACVACHTMGYLGGRVGPDLTRIGRIRSERDLLEAILFPSASFVRSYEPTTLLLTDGRVLNGVIRDETSTEITLQLDAQKSVDIAVDDIEERLPGTVSVMPAGLDKQLTPQQLADLVTFLKAAQ